MGVLNAAQGALNAAGTIASAINGLSPKEFYSVADFYNFIKKPDNVPTNHPLFTVVPSISNNTDRNGNPFPIMKVLFTDEWLAKFSLCIQKVQLPNLTLAQGGNFGNAVDVDGPQGWFKSMANTSPTNASSKEFTINFLDTHDPVIEKFIYPWFIYCMRTNDKHYTATELEKILKQNYSISSAIKDTLKEGAANAITWATKWQGTPPAVKQLGESASSALKKRQQISIAEGPYTFPRMDLVIKFYRPDEVMGITELMNPNFIYKIYGAYPIDIKLVDPQSGKDTGASNLMRPVKFAYNHIVVLPDAQWESNYFGTSHFPYQGLSPAKLINQAQNAVSTVSGEYDKLKRAFQ